MKIEGFVSRYNHSPFFRSQEVLWSVNRKIKKIIHTEMVSKKLVPARSPSSIVCLACARQGRPNLTKALRAGVAFCGSTVD
jgi:hypothetical protein